MCQNHFVWCYSNYHNIITDTQYIDLQYGSLAGPFGPVVDGPGGILPDKPKTLRENGKFMKMKIISGVTTDEGAYFARKSVTLSEIYLVIFRCCLLFKILEVN